MIPTLMSVYLLIKRELWVSDEPSQAKAALGKLNAPIVDRSSTGNRPRRVAP